MNTDDTYNRKTYLLFLECSIQWKCFTKGSMSCALPKDPSFRVKNRLQIELLRITCQTTLKGLSLFAPSYVYVCYIGADVCCIRELSISHHHSICKLTLNEHESCGPINLFHQDTMRAHMEPICGPCKAGLSCKGVG